MDWLRGGNALEDDAGWVDEVGITMCALSGIDHLAKVSLNYVINYISIDHVKRLIKSILLYLLHDRRIKPLEEVNAKVDRVDPPDVLRERGGHGAGCVSPVDGPVETAEPGVESAQECVLLHSDIRRHYVSLSKLSVEYNSSV